MGGREEILTQLSNLRDGGVCSICGGKNGVLFTATSLRFFFLPASLPSHKNCFIMRTEQNWG